MKVSRVARLAAIQLCWAVLIPGAALAAGAPAVWSDLWRTPDQQGQALLDAGEPAAAAARFRDPRRRAYADLEAGRYPQAAKLLAPFTDPRSEYNRGNALARAGQLQAALASYDAALKQAPADRDIRHNRDLVERALRKQRQSSRSQGRRGGRGAASSGQKPQQSAAGRQGGSGSRQAGSRGSQPTRNGQVASNGSQAGAAGHSGSTGQQQSGQSGNSAEPGTAQARANGSSRSKDTPGQARRDAALAAALAREQRRPGGTDSMSQAQGTGGKGASKPAAQGAGKGTEPGSLLAGGNRTPRQKPETERQLALDQWLRQIPESPAGLLRRKFLIEHMMKQQDAGDSQEPGQ